MFFAFPQIGICSQHVLNFEHFSVSCSYKKGSYKKKSVIIVKVEFYQFNRPVVCDGLYTNCSLSGFQSLHSFCHGLGFGRRILNFHLSDNSVSE